MYNPLIDFLENLKTPNLVEIFQTAVTTEVVKGLFVQKRVKNHLHFAMTEYKAILTVKDELLVN